MLPKKKSGQCYTLRYDKTLTTKMLVADQGNGINHDHRATQSNKPNPSIQKGGMLQAIGWTNKGLFNNTLFSFPFSEKKNSYKIYLETYFSFKFF